MTPAMIAATPPPPPPPPHPPPPPPPTHHCMREAQPGKYTRMCVYACYVQNPMSVTCVKPSLADAQGVCVCLCLHCMFVSKVLRGPVSVSVSVSASVCIVCMYVCAEQGGHAYEVPHRRQQRQVQPHHRCSCKACTPQGAHLSETYHMSGSTHCPN